jgi:hypothetical protein
MGDGRQDGEPGLDIWMADGGLQGDPSAQRIAEDIGIPQTELPDQGGNIIRHAFETQRAIDVGGVPVGLQLDANDLPVLSKGGSTWANMPMPPRPPCSKTSGRREPASL